MENDTHHQLVFMSVHVFLVKCDRALMTRKLSVAIQLHQGVSSSREQPGLLCMKYAVHHTCTHSDKITLRIQHSSSSKSLLSSSIHTGHNLWKPIENLSHKMWFFLQVLKKHSFLLRSNLVFGALPLWLTALWQYKILRGTIRGFWRRSEYTMPWKTCAVPSSAHEENKGYVLWYATPLISWSWFLLHPSHPTQVYIPLISGPVVAWIHI